MSAKERKRKFAKERKKGRKRAFPRNNRKQPGLKQLGLGIPNVSATSLSLSLNGGQAEKSSFDGRYRFRTLEGQVVTLDIRVVVALLVSSKRRTPTPNTTHP